MLDNFQKNKAIKYKNKFIDVESSVEMSDLKKHNTEEKLFI